MKWYLQTHCCSHLLEPSTTWTPPKKSVIYPGTVQPNEASSCSPPTLTSHSLVFTVRVWSEWVHLILFNITYVVTYCGNEREVVFKRNSALNSSLTWACCHVSKMKSAFTVIEPTAEPEYSHSEPPAWPQTRTGWCEYHHYFKRLPQLWLMNWSSVLKICWAIKTCVSDSCFVEALWSLFWFIHSLLSAMWLCSSWLNKLVVLPLVAEIVSMWLLFVWQISLNPLK